jgi:hypothetical protein
VNRSGRGSPGPSAPRPTTAKQKAEATSAILRPVDHGIEEEDKRRALEAELDAEGER